MVKFFMQWASRLGSIGSMLSLKQIINHFVRNAKKAVFCLGRSFPRPKEMTKDTFFK